MNKLVDIFRSLTNPQSGYLSKLANPKIIPAQNRIRVPYAAEPTTPTRNPVKAPYNTQQVKAMSKEMRLVKNLQRQLYEQGFLKGDKEKVLDGIWGDQTQKAWELAKSRGYINKGNTLMPTNLTKILEQKKNSGAKDKWAYVDKKNNTITYYKGIYPINSYKITPGSTSLKSNTPVKQGLYNRAPITNYNSLPDVSETYSNDDNISTYLTGR